MIKLRRWFFLKSTRIKYLSSNLNSHIYLVKEINKNKNKKKTKIRKPIVNI